MFVRISDCSIVNLDNIHHIEQGRDCLVFFFPKEQGLSINTSSIILKNELAAMDALVTEMNNGGVGALGEMVSTPSPLPVTNSLPSSYDSSTFPSPTCQP